MCVQDAVGVSGGHGRGVARAGPKAAFKSQRSLCGTLTSVEFIPRITREEHLRSVLGELALAPGWKMVGKMTFSREPSEWSPSLMQS